MTPDAMRSMLRIIRFEICYAGPGICELATLHTYLVDRLTAMGEPTAMPTCVFDEKYSRAVSA